MKRLRRSKIELMTEILRVCHSGVNKTRIISSTNLNCKITTECLNFLVENNYIVNGDNSYQISKNGLELLNKINEIHTIFNYKNPK